VKYVLVNRSVAKFLSTTNVIDIYVNSKRSNLFKNPLEFGSFRFVIK